MAVNINPIFPLTPYAISVSLAAVTACTTRAPTVTASLAAANIILLCPASTNGRRVDLIQVQGASSAITAPTAAQLVDVWMWDGTTAFVIDQITVSLVTPSTTSPQFTGSKAYTTLVLPAAFRLYVSTSITTTASTTALSVSLFGGDY